MIRITGQIRSTDNILLDGNYGPYESVHAAHTYLESLIPALNKIGVTVGIKNNTTHTIEEYWYQGGTTEAHLVKKGTDTTQLEQIVDGINENYLKAGQSSGSSSVDFDAFADTIHNNAQTLSSTQKQQARQNIDAQKTLESGVNIKTINRESLIGSGNITIDYSELSNRPQINSITLSGNKSASTLGLATAVQGTKADNAIPMPTGGSDEQILAKDSNETAGVKWVNKPSDGKSAYQIAVDNGFVGSESEWLASLKAQFGSFVPADYGTDGKPASGGTDITASASTTNYIYLVDNLSSNPTAKVMWITVVNDSVTPNTYSWQSIGEVQVSLLFASGQQLNQVRLVNDLATGGIDDVLSAEQGNRLYSILNAKTEKKSVNVVAGQALTYLSNLYNDVSLPIGSFIKIKLIKVTEYLSQFQIVNGEGVSLITISSFSNGDEFIIMMPTSTTKIGLYISSGDYVIASGAVELEFTVNYQDSISYQTSDLPEIRSALPTKVTLGVGKNLFDKNVVDSGYYLYRGKVYEQSAFRTSSYIEVKEQTYYTQSPQQNYVSVHFYDENLRYIGYSDNPGTFQTPSGTKFIRTSMIANSLNSTQIEEGQEATIYENFNPLFKYSTNLIDVQQNVLFNLRSSLLKDGTNNDFVNVKRAISNVRIWGLQNGSVFGISYINTQITTSKGQLFFNLITNDGTNYKCHYMFDNSIINNSGNTYFTIYRDNLSCYPSDYNKSVLPSEIRLSIDFSKIGADSVGSYNPNTAYLPFSELVCNEFENPYTLLNEGGSSDIYITCKRTGTSGVDADFCGLNAIGDAIASITDAGEDKQYYLMIDGHFLFTDPRMVEDGGDFKYKDGGEPSVIIAKKYVHFVGVDKSRAVIEVNLDASLVPNTTDFAPKDGGGYLDFTDYQPIYIRQSCHAKNITFIGTNDRYTVHVETNNLDKGLDIHFENCDIVSRVSTKGYKACMVVGEVPYSRIKMENCNFINDNNSSNCTLFSGHTPLSNITNGRENCSVEFDGCYFMTVGNIGLGTYNYNRKDVEIFKNCSFHPLVNIVATSDSSSRKIIGTLVDQRFSNNPLPFHTKLGNVYGLRITTTVGDTSSVRFDKDCSAFGIIGDLNDETVVTLPWSATKQYGYEYKDDANGSHAYACGWVNVYNSLGTLLGDCSVTSKTLRIIINGTNYDVDFTTDLTNESDENIIAMINDVISSVAICDTFDPEANVYPQFDGEEFFITNGDSSVIERGMGVIKTSYDVIRKAKQSDGYIDGIAVDTIYPGQVGRIITKGKLWSNNSNDASYTYHYFNINPIITSGLSYGIKLSINPNEDGKFIISNDAPVLKYIGNQMMKII